MLQHLVMLKNDLNSYDERKQALLKTIQSLNSIETTMQAQEKKFRN